MSLKTKEICAVTIIKASFKMPLSICLYYR